MFAKICFCLVNLWLWTNTAKGLPVNHALADFLQHNSNTNSLVNQNSNVRFESKRYFPRYKTFASYPVYDVRSRPTFQFPRSRLSTLPSTTPLSLIPYGFLPHTNPANLLPNVEATSLRVDSTYSTTQNFPTTTLPTTPQFGEILSMRVSTSVTNSHRQGEHELHTNYPEKPQVRESTTELYHEATVPSTLKPDDYVQNHNTVLDTQTTQRYNVETSPVTPRTLGIIAFYNMDSSSDTTQLVTTTSATLVNPNDLTKSRSMDYYSYQEVENHVPTEKPSVDFQTKPDEQPSESKAVTTRILPEYLPTPEQNYEVSEEDSVRSNGRIHGVQTTTSTEKTFEISDEAKAEADRRKSSYVVEGRNYKKYRVEEETSDGFIVGEYGVFSHNDGSMRGVRYTAESNINPRLIYNALLKFLSLQ
ncbi:hypothetical protein M8J76_011105 [Diaphorina citri]|nr:hypothetical protein M8J76_011105 [Diaphorina citri]KAI5755325.1 hypothetical protein M8J77_015983 [Diaphorina citri]